MTTYAAWRNVLILLLDCSVEASTCSSFRNMHRGMAVQFFGRLRWRHSAEDCWVEDLALDVTFLRCDYPICLVYVP